MLPSVAWRPANENVSKKFSLANSHQQLYNSTIVTNDDPMEFKSFASVSKIILFHCYDVKEIKKTLYGNVGVQTDDKHMVVII